MSLKKYADTDFFLALMKDSDWLKKRAKEVYLKNKGDIYVTPFTIAEVMIVCKREGILLRETLYQISRIVKMEGQSWEVFFRACDYIEKGGTIFDSLLMSSCGEDNLIISSDKVYRKFGFDVIDLRE